MMKTIPKPQISTDFTVDDIHKIRKWHEAVTHDMTDDEFCAFYNDGATEILENLGIEANIVTPETTNQRRTAS